MIFYFGSAPFVPIVNHCENNERAVGSENNMHARSKLDWLGTIGKDAIFSLFFVIDLINEKTL